MLAMIKAKQSLGSRPALCPQVISEAVVATKIVRSALCRFSNRTPTTLRCAQKKRSVKNKSLRLLRRTSVKIVPKTCSCSARHVCERCTANVLISGLTSAEIRLVSTVVLRLPTPDGATAAQKRTLTMLPHRQAPTSMWRSEPQEKKINFVQFIIN